MVESFETKDNKLEVQVSGIRNLEKGGLNPEEVKLTILSPKQHSLETLREQAPLKSANQYV
ncbi:MAG: hypothetical protein R2793_05145 [Flavobacteriaceae bacterium]